MVNRDELLEAIEGAPVAEVVWRRPDGSIGAAARTPLRLDDAPVLALTFDDLLLAEELTAASTVGLAVSDARMALRGWRPVVATGGVQRQVDLDGAVFVDRLVGQELRKHPPARLRADSLLQRRENWWYLPRLIVRLEPDRVSAHITGRDDPDHGVVAWRTDDGLRIDTVEVDDWQAARVRLRSLGGHRLAAPSGTDAALLRHDASTDLERRTSLTLEGKLEGDLFVVERRTGSPELPPVPNVWRRLRQAKAFERACRRGIAAAERASPSRPPPAAGEP